MSRKGKAGGVGFACGVLRASEMIFFLEGNIASGKTTLLQALRERGMTIIEEPVARFSRSLAAFHARPTRRTCLTLQRRVAYLCADMQSGIETFPSSSTVIIERSIFAAQEIFARMHEEAGLITERDRWSLSRHRDKPGIKLYLQTPASVCEFRAAERARPEEKDMDTKTFEVLHRTHERALNKAGLEAKAGEPMFCDDNTILISGAQEPEATAYDAVQAIALAARQHARSGAALFASELFA